MIYHVAKSGADHNSGTENAPFLTIQRAADVAQPGDTVLVHEGVYREWVRPRAGGTSDACRITYAAANGEHVTVKGSERVDWWQRQEGTVWKAVIPNRVFGKENPYKERVWGDWLVAPIEPYAHLGAVYMNGQAFYEAFSYGAVCAPEKREYSRYETWAFRREAIPEPELTVYQWYAEAGEEETVIYANFHGADPNRELVEINVRTACFFPEETNLNYITVRGFEMAQAACPWAPPTSRQLGLLGCHWSKGWIIENNHFHHAKCSAVSLGKEISTGDNEYTKTGKNPGYQTQMETVFRGIHAGWRKDRIGSHIVRNNQIHDCGQNAIVGHMGCAFSEIYGNEIYNIAMGHEFYGHEIAGIKFHGAVDTHIHHNYIHHCTLGLWLDWQAQGVRVSGNVFTENYRDLMIEVTHGPHLVDNNVFGSDFSLVNAAQGGAYVYNLFGGFMQRYPVLNRATPYHFPHSTDVLGVSVVYGGDDRWLCNLFAPQTVDPAPYAAYGTADYNGSPASLEEYLQRVQSHGVGDVENFEKIQQPVYINGNAYTGGARHFDREGDYVELKSPMGYRIAEDGNTVYLEIEADPALFPMPEYRITAEDLPQARIVRQGFENADAMPAQIEKGWLRELRPGYNRIALWHKKKTDI
ncbi:MAG: DUF1565 domain-containing protein [Ruminococcaceae bacterium]|nr:DUF1565 domain-containing protein [Oscillospiraceae bacterium]